MGGIWGISPLQTCWAGFWVIKIPPLLSSLLSEATVSAPSDMLAHVHLLGLSFPPASWVSLCYLPAAKHTAFPGRHNSPEVFFPCPSGCLVFHPFLSFPHPHVIAIMSPWRQGNESSLIFVFFPTFSSTHLPLTPVSAPSLSTETCHAVFSGSSLVFNSEMIKQTKKTSNQPRLLTTCLGIPCQQQQPQQKQPWPDWNMFRQPEYPSTSKCHLHNRENNKYHKNCQEKCEVKLTSIFSRWCLLYMMLEDYQQSVYVIQLRLPWLSWPK